MHAISLRVLPAVLLALGIVAPLHGQVCDASAFGPPTADPITITGTWTVGNGCILDFGDREVILDGTLHVDSVTILAGDLSLTGGARILGGAGTLMVQVTASAAHAGAVTIGGKIRMNDAADGGWVQVKADGPIAVLGSGKVEAYSTTSSGSGGSVDLTSEADLHLAGAVTTIDVTSGSQGFGGTIYLESVGDLLVEKDLDASGGVGDGGSVELFSVFGSVTSRGVIDVRASGDGYGGDVTFNAGRDIELSGAIQANGGAGSGGFGGDGGTVDVTASGWVRISADVLAKGGLDAWGGDCVFAADAGILQTGGKLSVSDTSTYGVGGSIGFWSEGPITLDGLLELQGNGSSGDGGTAWFTGDAVTLRGDIRATGEFGGEIQVEAAGPIQVTSTLRVDSQGGLGAGGKIWLIGDREISLAGATLNADGAGSSGGGGEILLVSGGDLLPDGATLLRAGGNATGGGSAGTMTLSGCQVILPAGFRAQAEGSAMLPQFSVTARDLLQVQGELRGSAGGLLLTTRLDDPWSPDLAGATITPAPTVVHDGTLPPCLGLGFVEVSNNSPVHLSLGEAATLLVVSSPNRPLVVLADWQAAFLTLGPWGYQQLDPASAMRLADPGYFGSPIPGSSTDSNGLWSYTSPVLSTALIGRTARVEVIVEDPALARNGWFHQAPLSEIQLVR